jgi:AcrR family transcriptional regulator
VTGEDGGGGAVAAPPTTKGRSTRQRLLSVATSLFAEKGYSRVRVADIAAAAGLSPAAFYRYFNDRHELMLTLLQQLTAEAFDFVRVPWRSDDPMYSVLRSTQLYFEFYAGHRALFGLLVELSQTDPEVARIWADSRRLFYSRIAVSLRREVRAGRLRVDVDVDVAAELLGSMTEFYAFQRLVLSDGVVKDVPLDESANALARIWTSGLVRRVGDTGKRGAGR